MNTNGNGTFTTLNEVRQAHDALLTTQQVLLSQTIVTTFAKPTDHSTHETNGSVINQSEDAGEKFKADFSQQLKSFLQRTRQAGRYLDNPGERHACQSMVNLWAGALSESGEAIFEIGLEPFDPATAPMLPDVPCPYQGLQAFVEDRHAFFFGRQRLVEELIDHLKQQRLLVVVGASGSGKSSLVLAGLLPKLKAGALSGSEGWRYVSSFVPGSDPVRHLAQKLLPLLSSAAAVSLESLIESITTKPAEVLQLLAAKGNTPVLLVVDQFEEVFTLCEDVRLRESFVACLLSLISAPEIQCYVVLTMRSDFEENVATIEALRHAFELSRVSLSPLGIQELRDIIELPATKVGLKIDERVVSDLIDKTIGQPASLPLLQFTLYRLWEKRQRNRITLATYRQLGDVLKSLQITADKFYEGLIEEDQVVVRHIFLCLIRLNTNFEPVGQRTRRVDIFNQAGAPTRVERMLDQLIHSTNLLKLTRGELPEDDQIEVAHESLIRNWPRIRLWLEPAYEQLKSQLLLSEVARRWYDNGRESSLLLRGRTLRDVLRFKPGNKIEQLFLLESRKANHIRTLRWTLSIAGLIVAFTAAIITGISLQNQQLLYLQSRQEVSTIKRDSELEKAKSLEQMSESQQARVLAEARSNSLELASVANTQLGIDTQRSLLVALEANHQAFTFESEDALRRAIDLSPKIRTILDKRNAGFYRATFSPNGKQIATADEDGYVNIWNVESASVTYPTFASASFKIAASAYSAEFSPDGRHLVVAAKEQPIGVFDVKTGQKEIDCSWDVGSDAFSYAAYSLQGDRIVAAGSGAVVIWKIAGQTCVVDAVLEFDGYSFVWAEFSRDGSSVVAAAQGKPTDRVMIWNPQTNEKRSFIDTCGTAEYLNTARFSPDAKFIVLTCYDGIVKVLDAQSQKRLFVLTHAHERGAWNARFSNDGRFIVSVGRDGILRKWDALTGRPIAAIQAHQDRTYSGEYSPDDLEIVTASDDGTAIVWSSQFSNTLVPLPSELAPTLQILPGKKRLQIEGSTLVVNNVSNGEPLFRLYGHTDRITDASFSADGTLIVTASSDRTARIWNANTGDLLSILRGHVAALRTARFSSDGRYVVTESEDGLQLVHIVHVEDLITFANQFQRRELTCDEQVQLLGKQITCHP